MARDTWPKAASLSRHIHDHHHLGLRSGQSFIWKNIFKISYPQSGWEWGVRSSRSTAVCSIEGLSPSRTHQSNQCKSGGKFFSNLKGKNKTKKPSPLKLSRKSIFVCDWMLCFYIWIYSKNHWGFSNLEIMFCWTSSGWSLPYVKKSSAKQINT